MSMNRRSFLRRLAGVFAAPLAAIPIVEDWKKHWRDANLEYVNIYRGNDQTGYVLTATIGESVSWHLGSDKDGNATLIYDEDEETVRKFYANWNNPS